MEITNTDLHTVNIEGIDHPAKLLAKILSSVGINYQKSRDNAEMLVGNLNLSELHLEGHQRSSHSASSLSTSKRRAHSGARRDHFDLAQRRDTQLEVGSALNHGHSMALCECSLMAGCSIQAALPPKRPSKSQ